MTPDHFKSIRKHLGFTQKQFAKELGKGLRTIQDYEQGKYAVPLHVQKIIEYIFKIKRKKLIYNPFSASITGIEYPGPIKPPIEIDIYPHDKPKDIHQKIEKAINKSSETPTSDE